MVDAIEKTDGDRARDVICDGILHPGVAAMAQDIMRAIHSRATCDDADVADRACGRFEGMLRLAFDSLSPAERGGGPTMNVLVLEGLRNSRLAGSGERAELADGNGNGRTGEKT